jgi:type IV pilus assembly protein PilV
MKPLGQPLNQQSPKLPSIAAPRHPQGGSSLVEVLIALTLVALTMLGLLGLQLRSLSLQKDSFDRRNAASIVAGFAERITANYAGFETAAYNGLAFNAADAPPSALVACATCTAAQVAVRDWQMLQLEVRQRLPAGVAFVNTPANGQWTSIVVGWQDLTRRSEFAVAALVPDPVCAGVGVVDTSYRCYSANIYP